MGEFDSFQEGMLVCFLKKKYLKYSPDFFFSFHLNDTLEIFGRGLIHSRETNVWLVNEQ